MRLQLFDSDGNWEMIKDGDALARSIFKRHYSYNPRSLSKLFVGPGEKMVLINHTGDAIFVWRKYISDYGQIGVNCAVFRNESQVQSSTLILEAEKIAAKRWPNQRLFTYVNAEEIHSKNPGYCFKKAGWRTVGFTKKRRLVILEKVPT